LSAEQAIKFGLADGIYDKKKIAELNKVNEEIEKEIDEEASNA